MMTVDSERAWWQTPAPWSCVRCKVRFGGTEHIRFDDLPPDLTDADTCLCPECFAAIAAQYERDRVIGAATLVEFRPDYPGAHSGTVTYFSDQYGPITERTVVTPWRSEATS